MPDIQNSGRQGDNWIGGPYLKRALRAFVPQRIAHWAVVVDVSVEPDTIRPGEEANITVEIRNRLPIPISLTVTGPGVWDWSVGEFRRATDEVLYRSTEERPFALDGGERQTYEVQWDGRIKQVGKPTRWVELDPGEYEISALLSAAREQKRAVTTIHVV